MDRVSRRQFANESRLLRSQGSCFTLFRRRLIDRMAGVPSDELMPHRVVERKVEGINCVSNRPGADAIVSQLPRQPFNMDAVELRQSHPSDAWLQVHANVD